MLKVKKMKYVLPVLVAGLVSLGVVNGANAACGGVYLGGDIGYSNVHQDGFTDVTRSSLATSFSKSNSDTGLAGRVFGGYQFNQNFAAELGYTKFHNATAKAAQTVIGLSNSANGTIKEDAFDISGKGILPLQNGFSVYGKLGVAYLRGQGDLKVTQTVPGIGSTTVSASQDAHKIFPTFGVGVGYDINQNLTADVSYTRIQKVGNSSKLNSTDFVGAGLIYSFG